MTDSDTPKPPSEDRTVILSQASDLFWNNSNPIHEDVEEAKDFRIPIRSSKIKRCREIATDLSEESFVDLKDIAFATIGIGGGALFGAFAADMSLDKHGFYYTASWVALAVGLTLLICIKLFRPYKTRTGAGELLRLLPAETQSAPAERVGNRPTANAMSQPAVHEEFEAPKT